MVLLLINTIILVKWEKLGNLKKTRPTHRRTDTNLYPPKRQLTKASEPSFHLEGGAQGQI